jgi:hypothetical protein
VLDKYEDEDISTRQVNLWAHFASLKSRQEILRKYRRFQGESLSNAARIGTIVQSNDGQIDRDLFSFDPEYRIDPESHRLHDDVLAYNSVLKYLMDVDAFTGENQSLLDKNNRRKWPRMDHRHDYRDRMNRAHQALDPLADDIFIQFVDEAYWSHFSRGRFWTGALNEYKQFQKTKRIEENLRLGPLPPPAEYMESLLLSEPPFIE